VRRAPGSLQQYHTQVGNQDGIGLPLASMHPATQLFGLKTVQLGSDVGQYGHLFRIKVINAMTVHTGYEFRT
jgi:hypothetical protein